MSVGRVTKGVDIEQLAKLLEPFSPEEFLASSWGKTYRHIRGWPGKFAPLLPWHQLNEILRRHRLDFPRLRLVLDGKSLPASSYLRHTTAGRRQTTIPRLQTAKLNAQLRRGATLVLDAVDELFRPLEDLASGLELFFHEHVQINTYAGWHSSHGFDLHWDDHDVFILQVTGRKRWSVYGMTRAFPFNGDRATCPPPERAAPVWEATLEDGDFLYIPRGWWHVAQPLNEPTLHLTVGIHNRNGLDLFRWLTERLSASRIYRQDLPRFASLPERAAHLRALREELRSALSDDLLESYFAELDERAEPRPAPSLPWSAISENPTLANDWQVRLLSPRPLDFQLTAGAVEFRCMNQHWRFAVGALPVLRLLEEKRVCAVGELCDAVRDRLDAQIVRAFLGELLAHGLIGIVTE